MAMPTSAVPRIVLVATTLACIASIIRAIARAFYVTSPKGLIGCTACPELRLRLGPVTSVTSLRGSSEEHRLPILATQKTLCSSSSTPTICRDFKSASN
ncbi:hypothetical protein B0H11DRAFT_267818 [Mycena galericulata]|nr:hypothetical protein B0H11DRAFT_267818 [Mycena galericulata]